MHSHVHNNSYSVSYFFWPDIPPSPATGRELFATLCGCILVGMLCDGLEEGIRQKQSGHSFWFNFLQTPQHCWQFIKAFVGGYSGDNRVKILGLGAFGRC
jgi:hypothetical protein